MSLWPPARPSPRARTAGCQHERQSAAPGPCVADHHCGVEAVVADRVPRAGCVDHGAGTGEDVNMPRRSPGSIRASEEHKFTRPRPGSGDAGPVAHCCWLARGTLSFRHEGESADHVAGMPPAPAVGSRRMGCGGRVVVRARRPRENDGNRRDREVRLRHAGCWPGIESRAVKNGRSSLF
jgi:hypothetical protein